MSYLNAVLVAEARALGRAQRSTTVRHRLLAKRPFVLMLWQLGAEPFTAAAVAWGFGPKDRTMVVPGEPRDRELAFRALTVVAQAFNAWFEGPRDEAPQVVVPNWGTLTLMGRLGRRLAYLPTTGDAPASPDLVRFGRHLRFLADRTRHPGQQLVVVLTELLASHWQTELSDLETQSLAALDAAIAPPHGKSGHEGARDVEDLEIGPTPAPRTTSASTSSSRRSTRRGRAAPTSGSSRLCGRPSSATTPSSPTAAGGSSGGASNASASTRRRTTSRGGGRTTSRRSIATSTGS